VDTSAKPLLRIDSSLVLIPVHVSNAVGRAVSGLARENFRVFEDGTEQTISDFFTEDAPVSIGLLFDASGSMRPKMEKSSEAAAAFFRAANPEDEFFLVEFNDHARLTVPFTLDGGQVYSRISHTKPSGRTSLIDAIFLALQYMKSARYPRKALVVFSDGGDNWSRHSSREIRTALLESDVQLYAMGIFDPAAGRSTPAEERNGPHLLDDLADQSGGRLVPVNTLDELPAISRRISRELHSQYLLGYHSTNETCDGKYRRLKVQIETPDARALRVSFRQGYYAPAE
jgi:VWFA-related protein